MNICKENYFKRKLFVKYMDYHHILFSLFLSFNIHFIFVNCIIILTNFYLNWRFIFDKMDDLDNNIERVPIVNKIELEPNLTLEVASKWEMTVTLFTFLGIAAITIFVSCFGPSLEIKEETKNILDMHEDSAWSRFYMKFTNLKPSNKFQRFYIVFRRQSLGGQISAPVTANYSLTYFRNNVTIRHESFQNVKSIVKSTKTQLDSTSFLFLKENNIDYDVLLMNSSFQILTRAYQFSTFVWEYGCSLHEKMILGIRMVYAAVEVIFLAMMIVRLKKFPKETWRPEQKFTLYLLISAILYNNPLELINQSYPNSLFHFLDILFYSIFKAYFLFYLLVIFDLANYKNRLVDSKFYSAKVSFYGLYAFFIFASKAMNDFNSLSENIVNIITYTDYFFIAISSIWTIIIMRSVMERTDATEQFILYLYIGSIGVALLLIGIGKIMLDVSPILKDKPFNSLLTHAVVNILVLFMVEVHFPALPGEEILFNEANSDEILEIEKLINDEESADNEKNKNKLFGDINVNDDQEGEKKQDN